MSSFIAASNLNNTYTSVLGIVNNIFTQDASVFQNFPTTPSYIFVDALRQTMHNLGDLLDVSLLLYGLNTVSLDLQEIEAISLPLSTQDNNYLSTRELGIATAINALTAAMVVYPQPVGVLVNGTPMVSGIGYLEYMAAFAAETPPSNATAVSAIYSAAADESSGWIRIQTALNTSGIIFPAALSDILGYMNAVQTQVVSFCQNYISLSSSLPVSTLWNYCIALWTYQDMAAIYYNDPTNPLIQALMVLKYSIKQCELTCANLLIAYMNQINAAVATAPLYQGQTLLDFANQNLGDYTQWNAVAAANNLNPPYTATAPTPGLASPGQQLFLPGSTPSGPIGNYFINFLGSDINIGIPQGTMPPWNGDFQTVNGYTNLRYALARRLLTPLGSFIYHPDYGSYLATYMGNPLSIASISVILAYVQSALLSDPRVSAVTALVPALTADNNLGISSAVQAAGGPPQNTSVNIVLQPGAVAQSGN